MHVKIDETDKKRLAQLTVILNRSKIECEGTQEILGAAQALDWFIKLKQRFDMAVDMTPKPSQPETPMPPVTPIKRKR